LRREIGLAEWHQRAVRRRAILPKSTSASKRNQPSSCEAYQATVEVKPAAAKAGAGEENAYGWPASWPAGGVTWLAESLEGAAI